MHADDPNSALKRRQAWNEQFLCVTFRGLGARSRGIVFRIYEMGRSTFDGEILGTRTSEGQLKCGEIQLLSTSVCSSGFFFFFFLRNPKSISTWNIKLILLKKSGNGRRKLLCGRRCKSSQRQTKRQLNHLQTLKQQSQKPKNNVAKEHENIYREAVLPAGGTCPREYYYKKRNLCIFCSFLRALSLFL